jgi:hypothetical protein
MTGGRLQPSFVTVLNGVGWDSGVPFFSNGGVAENGEKT